MVAAQLVRRAARDTTLYIIAPDITGHGLAYGTRNTAHLLNVPAGRMGAFADAVDGFYRWLSTPAAALAKQQLRLTQEYRDTDFVPRALYGAYLTDIWRETQEIAAQHGCILKLVETTATRIRTEGELAVLTARGDAIAVDKVVLATGNETKPIWPQVKSAQVIQSPWAAEAFVGAAQWASPVLLFGAGLTAVDTLMTLRGAGYMGEVVACSRHGRWPAGHVRDLPPVAFAPEEIAAPKTLQHLLRLVRSNIAELGEWRGVIDALRPHTQALWQRFTPREQQRFLRRLLSVWNVHRHRMAPEIAATIAAETMKGNLRLRAVHDVQPQVNDGVLQVTLDTARGQEMLTPSRVINCTGSELAVSKSANVLLKQALADHVLEPHVNGLGVSVDLHHRAWGAAHPNLYVIGTWMTGQLLESTAVPELRGQAAAIAAQILGRG